MSTTIAISIQKNNTISGHAGKCRRFTVYTVDTEGNYTHELLELNKGEALHDALHGDVQTNAIFDMDILLTQSLGQAAIEKLAIKDVRAYVIKEEDPETAIKKLIDGTLQAHAGAEHQHQGHDHGHNHGHAGCNCGGGH